MERARTGAAHPIRGARARTLWRAVSRELSRGTLSPVSSENLIRSTSLRPNRLVTLLCAALCALATDADAFQLKLPRQPPVTKPSGGGLAPYRVCSVCQARNYTNKPMGRVDAQGRELAWCDACRRDTAQAFSTATNTGPGIPTSAPHGQLKLPRTLPPEPVPAVPPPDAEDPRVPATPPGSAQGSAQPGSAQPGSAQPGSAQPGSVRPMAAALFAEVAKLKSGDEGTAHRAVESLVAMGPDGLAAARVALFEDKIPTIVVAARVLLRGGHGEEADLVVRRLRAKLPGGAGPPLLREVVAGDPVRATPELFVALLDHPQAALRTAASRELRPRLQESMLPLLEPVLVSSRSETRALALELAASLSGTRATAAVLTRLDDPNPRVASAAIAALRVRDDEGLDAELLRRAFGQRWILRPNAYALLAILDREDAELRPILLDEHVMPLLEALDSSDPFLSGSSAAALAGLGFRSNQGGVSAWLDSTVVDRLVVAVSGKVFHDDMSSLVGPAVRRLRLLSGETFGPDGPAWVDWWLRVRVGFHAHRAALPIQPGEEGAIRIALVGAETGLDVELLGPDVDVSARKIPHPARESIRLTADQAAELASALVREGVLAADRMPGAYMSEGRTDRTLEIDVHGRTKGFVVGPRARAPWFERLVSLVESMREQNRWQVLVEMPAANADRSAWDAESAWWSEPRTDAEREARLGELAIAGLRASNSHLGERALTELERAGAADALPISAYPDLLAALRMEQAPTQRARRLLTLAIHAGRAQPQDVPTEAEAASPRASRLDAATAQRLVDAVEESLGLGTGDLVAEVLESSERTYVRRLAADVDPVRRRAATAVLGQQPDDEDARVLLGLLNDPDARVHTTAAEALGAAKIEIARDDLLSRARLGEGLKRQAALRAAGALGGPHVLDALVLGVADPDPAVQRAAVEGLGLLRDPAAAQVLVNLLPEAGDAPLGDTVRTALVRVGEPAVPALRRAAEATDGKSRRDAALVLAQLLSPDAAPALLAIVTQTPSDKHVANELATLTCFDPRETSLDPVADWWAWWEGVRHDDALIWFRAGVERLGIAQPPVGALEGEGTRDGQRFLLTLLEREETWLAERAWRELGRLSGEPRGTIPPRGTQRARWIRDYRARLAARGADDDAR